MSRGFSPNDDFIAKFRWQLHPGTLKYIYERMLNYNHDDHLVKIKIFEIAMQEFDKVGLYCPGRAVKERAYW